MTALDHLDRFERWPTELARAMNVWDAADWLGGFTGQAKVERPVPGLQTAQTLSPKRWPDCPICELNVNHCECDVDAKYRALIARRDAGEN